MIRVLHIIGSLSRGGIESFLLNIHRNIDRKEVQFDYLINTGLAWQEDYAQEIKSLGGCIYNYPLSWAGLKQYRVLLKYKHYQIVHCHRGEMASIFLGIAKLESVPVRIVHSHSAKSGYKGLQKAVGFVLTKSVPLFATEMMACGQEAGKYLYGRHNFELVYNAIDVNGYKLNTEVGAKKRRQLGFVVSDLLFGHIGRIEPEKNHKFLIDIFAVILNKRSNAKLICVGDGSLLERMRLYAFEKGVDENVLFLGNREDVAELLQCMDCIIFPSFYEGFSVAMVEMQTASVPILTSTGVPKEISVIPELVCFKSLDDPQESWAEEAINMAETNNKTDRSQLMKNSGLDASSLAKRMQSYYLKHVVPNE